MSVALEDNKRTAIAIKLADMRALQALLIANDRTLIASSHEEEISNCLESILQDDQNNLAIIDSVIVQYGIKAEPKITVQKEIKEVEQMMQDSELTFFEKISEHELLKHSQAMSGILVHKAAQVVGADVAIVIAPLNAVNFENRAHEEQLKGMMESLSTLELTGQPSDNGLWSRVHDTIAALSGIAGGLIGYNDQDMTICNLLRLDHTKINALFTQIKATNDPEKIEEYFGQIYQDLSAHSDAEEQAIYPSLHPFYEDIQKLYDEQAEMKKMLDGIKAMNCQNVTGFKIAVDHLMSAVTTHVKEEEKDLFSCIRKNFGQEQQKKMAAEFKNAKSQIQDQRLALASSENY